MAIYDEIKLNNETNALLETAKKLATMLDALPTGKTRDAASLSIQIRGILERLDIIQPAPLNQDQEEARATVSSLTEQRRKRAS